MAMKTWPYPRVVAHRGGGALAPENTLAALDTSARLGHTMVEFDVKLSSDGIAILLHDDTLDRTTNRCGAAAWLCYAELAELDAGAWFDACFSGERIPTFEQAAARCRQHGLLANVEIKPCPGREAETGCRVAIAAAQYWHGVRLPPLLSSFSFEALWAARATAPTLPRGMLYDGVPVDWHQQAVETLECASLHINHEQLDQALVNTIKAAGIFILTYTVNELERAHQLLQWGVDSICTDRIDLIGPAFLDLAD